MNFKIIMIFFFSVAAQEMTPREKKIIAFMKSARSSSETKQAYLLSLTKWCDLGTQDFMKTMGEHVESFEEVLLFQKFMDDKVPRNPPAVFTCNDDGTQYYTKRFCNKTHQYILSEHSYLPDLVIIEERTTGTVVTCKKEIVHPKIKLKK
jgi:hypothetical protein